MFQFKLLGTAAGGGFPQWNCACSLCTRSRLEPAQVPQRLHLQAALSADGIHQYLINASPDLKFQIEAERAFWPSSSNGQRNTPIAGIILTSADLDQVLGLLLLREFQPLTVYATSIVRQILEANSFFRMLARVPNQLTWIEIVPNQPFDIDRDIRCTPIPLSDHLPFYAADPRSEAPSIDSLGHGQASIGLILESRGMESKGRESNGRRIAYTPALPQITETLRSLYDTCDAIFVDGTFWSNTELRDTHQGTPLARDIGHVPMSGADGSISLLSSLTRPQRMFVHLNNTNPVLDPRSPERKLVESAGWQIASDGWQWS